MPSWNENKQEAKLIDTLRDLFESQSRQIAQVSAQVNTVMAQQEALRTDFNAKWADLPRIYMPRQEDQARGFEGRVAALEEYRISSTKEISEIRMSVRQEVQSAALDVQKDLSNQRAGFDARTIAAWVSGFFLLANVIWSVVSHFIFK